MSSYPKDLILQLKHQPRDKHDTAWQGNLGGYWDVITLDRWIENRLKGSGIEVGWEDNCTHQGSKVQMSVNLQSSTLVDPDTCVHPTYLLPGNLGKVCLSSFPSRYWHIPLVSTLLHFPGFIISCTQLSVLFLSNVHCSGHFSHKIMAPHKENIT